METQIVSGIVNKIELSRDGNLSLIYLTTIDENYADCDEVLIYFNKNLDQKFRGRVVDITIKRPNNIYESIEQKIESSDHSDKAYINHIFREYTKVYERKGKKFYVSEDQK